MLLLCGSAIVYQDFKTRLISTWLIIGFIAANVWQHLLISSLYQLLENTIFCIFYFLFSFLVLLLFYYLKNKRFEKIMDSKLGWGDVLIFFAIGICIEPLHLIFFFTASFILSIFFYFLFLRKEISIPLAGLIIPLFFTYKLLNIFFAFS